ncbi:MAG TPA: MFS transporter [Thermomicrobiales bacterium]|nr:MFS transporter [Thermomicrobiales bacterium]
MVVARPAAGARWQFGLGRENGLLFWAVTFLEAAFGSYWALWPIWIEELNAPITLVGLLLGLGGILRLFVLLPSAWLSRRYGLKRVMIVARSIATIGIFSAALAPSWPWLLPALLGMAVGDLAFPLASTFVARNAGERRVRAFAIIFTTGPSTSLLITPLLSGALVATLGLRAPFVAAAIFSLISIALMSRLRTVPPPDDDDSSTGGYRGLLRVPGLPLLLGVQFLTFFAIGIGTSLLSIYLHEAMGYGEAVIPPMTALTAIGSITFSTIVARSSRLSGSPLRAVAIMVGVTASAFLLFLRADLLPFALLAMTLRGGFFSAWPLYSAALGEMTPDRLRPHVFAMCEILAGTGFVLAPVVAGPLYEIQPELPLLLAAAMVTPLALLIGARANTSTEPAVDAGVNQ